MTIGAGDESADPQGLEADLGALETLALLGGHFPGPEHLKRSPQPLRYTSTRQALRELRDQYRAFVAVF